MVKIEGFTADEHGMVRDMLARFSADDHQLDELAVVEKRDMTGYHGLVVPRPSAGEGFSILLLVATCSPFTVAHELAHVADIRIRRAETRTHLSGCMPNPWHLAHRMSSEYFANRTACRYVDEDDVLQAFKEDHRGFLAAAQEGDWATFLINYALLLGLFHGLGRPDCDPLNLLKSTDSLPEIVVRGAESFREESLATFKCGTQVTIPVDHPADRPHG